MGATLAVDPRERDLKDVQAELGMTEGFDIGLEMSGSADAGSRCSGFPPTASRSTSRR
jgi:hypothetical protein